MHVFGTTVLGRLRIDEICKRAAVRENLSLVLQVRL